MKTEITLEAVSVANSGTRYRVKLPSGEVLIESARDPEHEAARKLLAHGITGRLITRWQGSPSIALVLDIEVAATQTIIEGKRVGPTKRRWNPWYRSGASELPAPYGNRKERKLERTEG